MSVNAKTKPIALKAANIGREDVDGFFPAAVRLRTGGAPVLGSGVLVAPRWVLTASHLFQSPQPIVQVDDHNRRQTVEATEIHWRSGTVYRMGAGEHWPHGTAAFAGDDDELVLIKLAADMHAGYFPAPLNDGGDEVDGDSLFLAGFGADRFGNRRKGLNYASLICKKPEPTRGFAISDDSADPPDGMAQYDDSGAPVFLVSTKKQLRKVLVGIHSDRTDSSEHPLEGVEGKQEIARYIRIGGKDREWIRNTIAPPPAESTPVASRQPAMARVFAPARVTAGGFCLRGSHCCIKFNAPGDADNKIYNMNIVHGKAILLKRNDDARIIVDGNNVRWLEIRRCGAERVQWRAALTPYSTDLAEGYCLSGTVVGIAAGHPDFAYNGSTVFVYKLADSGSTIAANSFLRIETFHPGSSESLHVPSSSNIVDGVCSPCAPMIWEGIECDLTMPERVPFRRPQDQDDESDGYER